MNTLPKPTSNANSKLAKHAWELVIPKPNFPLKSAIEAMRGEPPQWLVKKLLPAKGLTIVFGAANSGKTFTVIDLALTLSTNAPFWMGHRCTNIGVIYLALEGSLSGRIQAWAAAHTDAPLFDATFAVFEGSADLFNGDCIPKLEREIHEYACITGWRASLIIIDTLVRASPGADENSVQDMSQIIKNMKRLEEATGCAILAIHHSGKNQDAGMRGSTALLGAADQVLQIAVHDGYRELSIHKSRDGSKDARVEFELQVMSIGKDEDGEEVTSCVVREREKGSPRKLYLPKPKGRNQVAVFNVLNELLAKEIPETGDAPKDRPSICVEDLIRRCKERLPMDPSRVPERVRNAVQSMATAGYLIFQTGKIWLP